MAKLDYMLISYHSYETRKILGLNENSPIDIEDVILNNSEYTLIYKPMSNKISGLCIKEGNNKIIAVNSNFSKGRQKFTMAHELCHLYYHDDGIYICSSRIGDDKLNDYEKEADLFASLFLAPNSAFYSDYMMLYNTQSDIEHICIKLEQKYGLSHMATLIRLKINKLISDKEFNRLQMSPIKLASSLGYSTELFLPTKKNTTMGRYISLAKELLDKDKISINKYESLLLDGNRQDLLDGDDQYGGID